MKKFIQSKWFIYTVFGVFTLIFIIWFFTSENKVTNSEGSDDEDNNSSEEQIVRFKEPTLFFFGQKIVVNLENDRLLFHYPYILVVKTSSLKTRIFNIETEQEEERFQGFLLDYDGDHKLEDRNGKTFFDDNEVPHRCYYGYIKSEDEILCTIHNEPNTLYSIKTKDFEKEKVFDVGEMITDFMYDPFQERLIIGAINTEIDNRFYLHLQFKNEEDTVGSVVISSPNLISQFFIYSNKNEKTYLYFASYRSALNDNTEGYYSISHNNENVEINTESEKEIVFYKK